MIKSFLCIEEKLAAFLRVPDQWLGVLRLRYLTIGWVYCSPHAVAGLLNVRVAAHMVHTGVTKFAQRNTPRVISFAESAAYREKGTTVDGAINMS